jgi:hypothetical protein
MIFEISPFLILALVLSFQDTVTAISVPREFESYLTSAKNVSMTTQADNSSAYFTSTPHR